MSIRSQIDRIKNAVQACYDAASGIGADAPEQQTIANLAATIGTAKTVWYPNVDDSGNISWTKSNTDVAPATKNIRGPDGASAVLTFTSKTVAVSSWASSSDQSGAGFPYRAAVALTGVTAAMVPDVYFSAADAVSGNFSPTAQSYAGGVYVYAASKPTSTVTIPTIRVTK